MNTTNLSSTDSPLNSTLSFIKTGLGKIATMWLTTFVQSVAKKSTEKKEQIIATVFVATVTEIFPDLPLE